HPAGRAIRQASGGLPRAAGGHGPAEAALPARVGSVPGPAQGPPGSLLLGRLPAGAPRQRRGRALDARQRHVDELRVRVPAGPLRSLYSACHGTGSLIDSFVRRGMSGLDPHGHSTLRFRYRTPEPTVVPHLDSRGVDEGLRILTDNDLVRPVARLRPFAVLN